MAIYKQNGYTQNILNRITDNTPTVDFDYLLEQAKSPQVCKGETKAFKKNQAGYFFAYDSTVSEIQRKIEKRPVELQDLRRTLIVIDYDGIGDITAKGLLDVVLSIAPSRSLAYTSIGNKVKEAEKGLRARVVIEPSRPITTQEQVMIASYFGDMNPILEFDGSIKSNMQGLPIDAGNYEFDYQQGAPLDVDALLSGLPTEQPEEPQSPVEVTREAPAGDMAQLEPNQINNLLSQYIRENKQALLEPQSNKQKNLKMNVAMWVKQGRLPLDDALVSIKKTAVNNPDRVKEFQDTIKQDKPYKEPEVFFTKKTVLKAFGGLKNVPLAIRQADPKRYPQAVEWQGEIMDWQQTPKGDISNNSHNFRLALIQHGFADKIGFDEVSLTPVWTDDIESLGVKKYDAITNMHKVTITTVFCTIYGFDFKNEAVKNVFNMMAGKNSFNLPLRLIQETEWDGVKRAGTWFHKYLGAEDTEYTRTVETLFFEGLILRQIHAGSRFEIVPVLQSTEQGEGKSSFVEKMTINPPRFFAKINKFQDLSKDDIKQNNTKLILELGELVGYKNVEVFKDFVSTTHDNFVPKYESDVLTCPRHFGMIATTNNSDFLKDTQNRRLLPIACGIEGKLHPMDITQAEVLQYYAEVLENVSDKLEWNQANPDRMKKIGYFDKTDTVYKQLLDEQEDFKAFNSYEELLRALLSLELSIDAKTGYVSSGSGNLPIDDLIIAYQRQDERPLRVGAVQPKVLYKMLDQIFMDAKYDNTPESLLTMYRDKFFKKNIQQAMLSMGFNANQSVLFPDGESRKAFKYKALTDDMIRLLPE